MASMNYCFTVCRAAEEKAQQKTLLNASSTAVDVPNSSSPSAGAYFFGRFFSFGTTPPASRSLLNNPFIIKASHSTDIDDDIF